MNRLLRLAAGLLVVAVGLRVAAWLVAPVIPALAVCFVLLVVASWLLLPASGWRR